MAALSAVESGDRDGAIGRNGELSRYQMMPAAARHEWRAWTPAHAGKALPAGWARDPALARRLAAGIWEDRAATFRVVYRRSPNLRELYLCWHRPGRVLAPKRRELARAERFANVVGRLTAEGFDRLSPNGAQGEK